MFEPKTVTIVLCCGILSACVLLESKPDTCPPAPLTATTPRLSSGESEALAWLSAYRVLANAPLDEQRKEYLAAQAALSKESNDSNRLRLALALSLPGVPWRDDNKLMATLDTPSSLLKLPDSPLHQLIFVIYKQAQERQRLREEQRKHENELLEEQKHLREEQKRHEAELIEAQRQNEELQTKLDALRRIDQDLKHRKHSLETTP